MLAAVLGVDAFDVTVAVEAANGLPRSTMVGTEPMPLLAAQVRAGPHDERDAERRRARGARPDAFGLCHLRAEPDVP